MRLIWLTMKLARFILFFISIEGKDFWISKSTLRWKANVSPSQPNFFWNCSQRFFYIEKVFNQSYDDFKFLWMVRCSLKLVNLITNLCQSFIFSCLMYAQKFVFFEIWIDVVDNVVHDSRVWLQRNVIKYQNVSQFRLEIH